MPVVIPELFLCAMMIPNRSLADFPFMIHYQLDENNTKSSLLPFCIPAVIQGLDETN
jgi:hypothetical protein